MPNVSTDVSSHSNSSSGSNGSLNVETETASSNYPQREYELEDFSQQRINRGQQEINYLITEANEKVLHALNEFRTALAEIAGPDFNWENVDEAIEEASKANNRIAGPFPPGCLKPE